jgi:murein biosynthesis integral membrane protein MurJ
VTSAATGQLQRTGIARAALLVAGVTVASRLVGFVRVLVFAHTVGPSCLGDAYYTANTVPNILFDVVAGGALSSIVVPVLAGAVDSGENEKADRTSSALLTWALLLLLPVAVIGLLVARPVMDALTGNGHPGCPAHLEQASGARMLQIFMPQVLLYGAIVVVTGVLQSHRRFLGAALAPLVSSLVVITAYLVFAATSAPGETGLVTLSRRHELVLSVGTTVGVVALLLTVVVSLGKTGRHWRPTLRFPPGVAASARRLAIAGAVVLGSQDIAAAAILRLANDRGADGAVVLYNLAWTVFLLPWAVLAVPLATAAFPALVARWQANERDHYAAATATTTRTVVMACAAAGAVMAAVAYPAARVVILGAPGGTPPAQLARAFVAFAPGLVGYGLVAHLSRVHYARDDARTPAVATTLGWLLVIAVDVVLVVTLPRAWTAAAFGIGTTIGMTTAAAFMAASLRRHVGVGCLQGLGPTSVTAIVAGLGSALAGFALARALPAAGTAGSVGSTFLVAVVCLTLYVAAIATFDRSTLRLVLRQGNVVR